jgi:hypothetical protein
MNKEKEPTPTADQSQQPNLQRLSAYYRSSPEGKERLFFNSKMIGKKVFCITFGGWYGVVKDMGYTVDEFMVERPTGKCFPVSIYDVRLLDYNIQEEDSLVVKDNLFENIP